MWYVVGWAALMTIGFVVAVVRWLSAREDALFAMAMVDQLRADNMVLEAQMRGVGGAGEHQTTLVRPLLAHVPPDGVLLIEGRYRG